MMNRKITQWALSLAGLVLSFSLWAAPVNVNQADAQKIASSLNGVGMVKAQAIVEYREQHGDFKTLQDLAKVKGIGSKTLEKNADDIRLEGNLP